MCLNVGYCCYYSASTMHGQCESKRFLSHGSLQYASIWMGTITLSYKLHFYPISFYRFIFFNEFLFLPLVWLESCFSFIGKLFFFSLVIQCRNIKCQFQHRRQCSQMPFFCEAKTENNLDSINLMKFLPILSWLQWADRWVFTFKKNQYA